MRRQLLFFICSTIPRGCARLAQSLNRALTVIEDHFCGIFSVSTATWNSTRFISRTIEFFTICIQSHSFRNDVNSNPRNITAPYRISSVVDSAVKKW